MTRRVYLNVSPTPELMTFVTVQVRSSHYGSAGEVVRTSVRLLEKCQTPLPLRIGASRQTTPDGR